MSPATHRILACFVSALLLPLAIHGWGTLIFLALSPFLFVVCTAEKNREVLLAAILTGWLASFLVQHTLWVFSVPGVAVLSILHALTWLPVAFGVRVLWTRWRIPMTLIWPLAWAAGEALRSMGPLGTTFGILTVPKTTELWMLQVADLGGARLAGMPLAMAQGWFADLALQLKETSAKGRPSAFIRNVFRIPRVQLVSAVLCSVWGFVAIYGFYRLSELQSELRFGPRVAVIETDIPAMPDSIPAYDSGLLYDKLKKLTEAAVKSGNHPVLVAWPEGIMSRYIPDKGALTAPYDPRMAKLLSRPGEPALSKGTLEGRWSQMQGQAAAQVADFEKWVDALGVTILVGSEAWVPTPAGETIPFHRFNAVLPFRPGLGQGEDFQPKVRLYALGEYAPWKSTVFDELMTFLLGPPRNSYEPGTIRRRLTLDSSGMEYVISICSEMTFQELWGATSPTSRSSKPFDLMVNIANEGVFLRNGMLDIFFFTARLRAIENRVTVARSSNAGFTGFVSPTGEPYGMVVNSEGKTRTGLGAPEIPLILELMRFRNLHEAEFDDDADLRANLQRQIDRIETVRKQVGVEGWSVQPILIGAKKPTLFQMTGDLLTPFTIIALIAMNLCGICLGKGCLRPQLSNQAH